MINTWEDISDLQTGNQIECWRYKFQEPRFVDGADCVFATEYEPGGKFRVSIKKPGGYYKRYLLDDVTNMEDCKAAALIYHKMEETS
jgi:hypothetical protein